MLLWILGLDPSAEVENALAMPTTQVTARTFIDTVNDHVG